MGRRLGTSQDSFGNLEASPPVTVDGVEYPFGRVYYGDWRGDTLHPDLANFLDNQSVQAPVKLDITWLCVGPSTSLAPLFPIPFRQGLQAARDGHRVGYDSLKGSKPIPLTAQIRATQTKKAAKTPACARIAATAIKWIVKWRGVLGWHQPRRKQLHECRGLLGWCQCRSSKL